MARKKTIPIERVIQFTTEESFNQAVRDVFSNEVDLQKRGMERLVEWQRIAPPGLRGLLESSNSLIFSSILFNMWKKRHPESLPKRTVQMHHGVTLVRFVVNILIANKDCREYSLKHLARKFDVPVFVVNMRNQFLQGEVPHLACLRGATKICIAYLKEHFFSRNFVFRSVQEPADIEQTVEEKVNEIIGKVIDEKGRETGQPARKKMRGSPGPSGM